VVCTGPQAPGQGRSGATQDTRPESRPYAAPRSHSKRPIRWECEM
jgi:hypothetical protein